MSNIGYKDYQFLYYKRKVLKKYLRGQDYFRTAIFWVAGKLLLFILVHGDIPDFALEKVEKIERSTIISIQILYKFWQVSYAN